MERLLGKGKYMRDLHWLIQESEIKNLKCMAGNTALDNTIEGTAVLDNPNTLRWVKPGELILTSGYLLMNNPELQKDVIKELKESGCAGLAIKNKTYFNDLPQEMLDEANRLGFPIIQIPYYYTLSDVSRAIYRHLFEANLLQKEKEQILMEEISDVFFSKRGVIEAIYLIANHFKRTVILVDEEFRCIYIAKRMVDKNICSKGDEVRRISITDDHHDIMRFQDKTERAVYNLMIVSNDVKDSLLIVEDKKRLTIHEENLIKRCSKILALCFQQDKIRHLRKFGFENANLRKFFEYLKGLYVCSGSEFKNLLKDIHFPADKKRVLLILVFAKEADYRGNIDEWMNIVLAKRRKSKTIQYFLVENYPSVFVYLFFDNKNNIAYVEQMAAAIAENLLEKIRNKDPGSKIRIGMSTCSIELEGISRNYREAEKALAIAEKLSVNTDISCYRSFIMIDAIIQYPTTDKIMFYERILILEEHDRNNNTEYVETLQAYLNSQCNSTEAANMLFIHRNTFINRMKKIKELLHTNLEDTQEVLGLGIEVAVYQYFKER